MALVPVTVYVALAFGLTVMLVPVCPVLQTYELAPVAVKVVDSPWQMLDEDAVTFTLIDGLTVITAEAVAEQPLVVPVTV